MAKKLRLNLSILFLLCFCGILSFAQASGQTQDFSNDKKINLIRHLVKKRIQNEPLLKKLYNTDKVPRVENFPEIVLMELPEGTIVTIVEMYWIMKNQTEASDKEIFDAIENYRKIFFSGSGDMPIPLTLSNYIKYRLKTEYSEVVLISNKFIEEAIEEANKLYRPEPEKSDIKKPESPMRRFMDKLKERRFMDKLKQRRVK